MSERVNTPCRNPNHRYNFISNTGKHYTVKASSEEEGAKKLFLITDDDITWLVSEQTGDMFYK